MTTLFWKKLNNLVNHGSIEAPSYPGDAGFNLIISKGCQMRSFIPVQLPCNIAIAIPDGYFGIPIARSSAAKKGILVFSTIIDSGYRGPLFIFAVLMTVDNPLSIAAGTSIAQLVLYKNHAPEIVLSQEKELSTSARGENGFGSSGKAVE